MYASMFQHFSDQRDFYMLLENQGLFHLVLDVLLNLSGPKPEHNNMEAYVTSFITYGTYGWIKEWMARGMKETAETMALLLSTNGMK